MKIIGTERQPQRICQCHDAGTWCTCKKNSRAHEYRIFNVALDIRKIEKDDAVFGGIIDAVRTADLVLWAFPLYFMLVPSQYKRFIELVFERHAEEAFSGKYTASLSTSIHFFDYTAHAYVHAICDDLGMRYGGFYSAGMRDLLIAEERSRLEKFAQVLFSILSDKVPIQREHAPLVWPSWPYVPGPELEPVRTGRKKVVILTDSDDSSANCAKMTGRLMQAFSGTAELVNLHDADIRGASGAASAGMTIRAYTRTGTGICSQKHWGQPTSSSWLARCMTVSRSTWKQFFDRVFSKAISRALRENRSGLSLPCPLQQLAKPQRGTSRHGQTTGGVVPCLLRTSAAIPENSMRWWTQQQPAS